MPAIFLLHPFLVLVISLLLPFLMLSILLPYPVSMITISLSEAEIVLLPNLLVLAFNTCHHLYVLALTFRPRILEQKLQTQIEAFDER